MIGPDRQPGLENPFPPIAGGSGEILLDDAGTYSPLIVNVEGRGPVEVPNFMNDKLWANTVGKLGEYYAARVALLPGGKITDDTLFIEELGVESAQTFQLILRMQLYWLSETGQETILPDALVDTSRRVKHLREDYNLTQLGDADVANACVANRVKLIKAAGITIDETALMPVEF